jgi:endonuclease/exonuclease/phosphatase family metal-dependent hydrolase
MPQLARIITLCTFLGFPVAVRAEEYVKIGSWNIEHLGKRTQGQNPKALAEYIFLAGVDVLALQEIYDTDGKPDTRTNGKLDQVFELLNKLPGQKWQYRLFANANKKDTSQLCGVAWNTARVTLVGEPFRIPVVDDDPNDEYRLWDRHPHAVKFSAGKGKTDFVVIPLHMKSNVDGVQFGKEQRKREAKALRDVLDKVRDHFKDKDIILIGDTNCLSASEEALQIFAADFIDLNAGDLSTFVTGKSPFDRILIPRGQPEFKFSQQYALVATNSQKHDQRLSDHFLILTVIQIDKDDDTEK